MRLQWLMQLSYEVKLFPVVAMSVVQSASETTIEFGGRRCCRFTHLYRTVQQVLCVRDRYRDRITTPPPPPVRLSPPVAEMSVEVQLGKFANTL